MSINVTHKGKAGEVEFCKWLKKNLGIDTERNYNQSQGGADVDTQAFLFEVKRRETLDLNKWWHQVTVAKNKHDNENIIPVVCFRQNRKKWEFLIPSRLIGVRYGYLQITEIVFKEFATQTLQGATPPLVI